MWTVWTRQNGLNYYAHFPTQEAAVSYQTKMCLAGHRAVIEPPKT